MMRQCHPLQTASEMEVIRSANLLLAELECSFVLADLQELRDTLLIRSKSGHLSDNFPDKFDTLAAPLQSSTQAFSCMIAAVLQAQDAISSQYTRLLGTQKFCNSLSRYST